MEQTFIIILYSMGIGVYLLALSVSLYYFFISKNKFAKNCTIFSFFTLIYAALSLEAGFPSSPTKNFFDVSILAFSGSMAFNFYILNVLSILGIENKKMKYFRGYFLFVAFIAILGIPSYLLFNIPLFLEFSQKQYLSAYVQSGMAGLDFSLFGQIILAIEILVTFGFFGYLVYKYGKLLRNEKLLSIGLVFSSLFVFHDNILGIANIFFIAPLLAVGNIPETMRFLRKIILIDYQKRIEYSQKLLESLQESEELRLSGQYIHDVSRVLNKLVFVDDEQTRQEIKNILESKYEALSNCGDMKSINVKNELEFTKEMFEIELRIRGISFVVNCADHLEISFVQSDFFIIFSNLIQNSIDHSICSEINVEVKDGAVETQIIYQEVGVGGKRKPEKVSSSSNIGKGISNAKKAALSNGATLNILEGKEGLVVKLRIIK